MEQYSNPVKIGEGTYGKVYRAIDRSGRVVAIKKCKFKDTDGIPPTALREISLVQKLGQCENIVKTIAVHPWKEGNDTVLFVVFEHIEQDLRRFLINQQQPLSPPEVKDIMFQILSGLVYCHRRGILHRDIKPQNVLIENGSSRGGCKVKVADFGLARAYSSIEKQYTHEVLTLWYRAPEILLGQEEYATAVDIWSAGCIFAELINQAPVFPGNSEIDQLFKIFRICGTPNENAWSGVTNLNYWHEFPVWPPVHLSSVIKTTDFLALELLGKMLVTNPEHRISAREALRHPYFEDLQGVGQKFPSFQSRMETLNTRRFRKAKREHR